MTDEKVRVLFIIPSLGAGGAERQLCELIRHMDHDRFDVHLAVFYDPGYYDGGELWPDISGVQEITVHALHKHIGLCGHLKAFFLLKNIIQRVRPQILHGYLGGNLPAIVLGKYFSIPTVWGIRGTDREKSKIGWKSRCAIALMVRLSKYVDLVIYNSEEGKRNYVGNLGMLSKRHAVVPNGIDIRRFNPDSAAVSQQHAAWEINSPVPVIGIVGRLHPVKDHPTFLRAAARVVRDWPDVRFVCIGGGEPEYVNFLKSFANSLGLDKHLVWAGISKNMPKAYNALSLLVLSSVDEGFPNAIGEGMACGIPCVTTRVGDAEAIVGETGIVVDVGDDAAIARGIDELLHESLENRVNRSNKARIRICANFSVDILATNTENVLLSLL